MFDRPPPTSQSTLFHPWLGQKWRHLSLQRSFCRLRKLCHQAVVDGTQDWPWLAYLQICPGGLQHCWYRFKDYSILGLYLPFHSKIRFRNWPNFVWQSLSYPHRGPLSSTLSDCWWPRAVSSILTSQETQKCDSSDYFFAVCCCSILVRETLNSFSDDRYLAVDIRFWCMQGFLFLFSYTRLIYHFLFW